MDDAGAPLAAFTALDVTRFIALDARRNGGLFDAEGRTVGDMLAEIDAGERRLAMPGDVALTEAIDALKGKQVDVVVGTYPGTGGAIGSIQCAHRRY